MLVFHHISTSYFHVLSFPCLLLNQYPCKHLLTYLHFFPLFWYYRLLNWHIRIRLLLLLLLLFYTFCRVCSKNTGTVFTKFSAFSDWIAINIYLHIRRQGEKFSTFILRETRDKRPLGTEPDRSWCHRHTKSMIKLFWWQPMAPWASTAA